MKDGYNQSSVNLDLKRGKTSSTMNKHWTFTHVFIIINIILIKLTTPPKLDMLRGTVAITLMIRENRLMYLGQGRSLPNRKSSCSAFSEHHVSLSLISLYSFPLSDICDCIRGENYKPDIYRLLDYRPMIKEAQKDSAILNLRMSRGRKYRAVLSCIWTPCLDSAEFVKRIWCSALFTLIDLGLNARTRLCTFRWCARNDKKTEKIFGCKTGEEILVGENLNDLREIIISM